MARATFIFTEQEKQQIKEAVEAAERKTSGEIIASFTEQSDDYEAIPLRVSLIFMTAGLFIAALFSHTWALPFPITILEIIIFALALGALGFILARFIRPFKRLMIPRELMQERVEQSALAAFLKEEVFKTEDRTGILIFVSHFEHMVEVIGDSGINAKVKPEEWQQVVNLIIEGIKAGAPAKGLVNGIHRCGELLERAGVHRSSDDTNELSDDVRLS